MSSSEIAVSVRDLSKAYTIAHQAEKHNTLAEALLSRARRPFQRTATEKFWALKDVNFEIKKGEVVGIIGRNGAGKSTLLKILSRITEPTDGRIDLYGRVGSLLEVGTGFHPELTGRENVYLNGAILGMRRPEIRRQFDAIVDFAGVQKFIDTPVKRYSSGMYVRLAFAVAAHLQSEILVVDEVLAVGDAEFQNKCLGKMRDVATTGRTVLFVSHNMGAVSYLCSSGLLLSCGQIKFSGKTNEAIAGYQSEGANSGSGSLEGAHVLHDVRQTAPDEEFCVVRVEMLTLDGKPMPTVATWDSVRFRLWYVARRYVRTGAIELEISSNEGAPLLRTSTRPDRNIPLELQVGLHAVDCVFDRLPLSAGRYLVTCGVALPGITFLWRGVHLAAFEVAPRDVFNSGLAPNTTRSLIATDHTWEVAGTSVCPPK